MAGRDSAHFIGWMWVRLVRFCCTGGLVLFVAAILISMQSGRAFERGGQLAYVSREGDRSSIYLVDVAHGTRFKLHSSVVSADYTITDLAWSPDGRQLAYIMRIFRDQWSGVLVLDVDRGSTHLVYQQIAQNFVWNSESSVHQSANVNTQVAQKFSFEWMPDSRQIAVLGHDSTGFNFTLVDVGEGSIQQFASHAEPVRALAWSPGDHRLAYASTETGSEDIWLWDMSGGDARRLTTGPAQDRCPVWSDDGTAIAFVSDRSDVNRLYVMKADEWQAYQIAELLVPASCRKWTAELAWSPDGTEIAFITGGSKPDQLFVVRADGSDLRQLTHDPAWLRIESHPDWSPDGERIAFEAVVNGSQTIIVSDRFGTVLHQITPEIGEAMYPVWRPM